MIVVDSSAVLAIFFEEPEKERFLETLFEQPGSALCAANLVEIHLRAESGLDEIGKQAFEDFMNSLPLEVIAVDAAIAKRAIKANRLYGRASGHPARLNFGDCFAYALAKEKNLPLLFKGNDFIHTDVLRLP